MHSIHRSILVPYSTHQMFALVADVEKYPEFMPWCGGAEVQIIDEKSVEASIMISFLGLRHWFTTRNIFVCSEQIELQLVKGPFSALKGQWKFLALSENACKVLFSLEYTFSNQSLEYLVGPVFNRIASSFIDSFTQRAHAKYERKS